jgi:hypothetical protein
MNLTKTRDRILAAVGGTALLIYVLACGPAFSPDDSKVLYPANDPKTGGAVLALYDRHARTSRALFALPNDIHVFMGSAWTQDGSRAIALWAGGDTNSLEVASIPLRTGQPIRVFTVAELTDTQRQASWAVPSAILGSTLFIGAKSAVYRADLDNGRQVSVPVEGDPVLFGVQNRVYYLRDLPDADKQTGRLELGLVDPKSLRLSPLHVLTGIGALDDTAFAVSRDGRQLAFMGSAGDSDKNLRILIFEDGQLRRTLPLAAATATIGTPVLRTLQWSRDAKLLYLICAKELGNEKIQLGIGEVSANGAGNRAVPLFTVGADGGDGLMNLELSHDGKTLATASTYMETSLEDLAKGKPQALEPKDLALYLIDVSSPGRKVTKVPIPPLPNVAPARARD